MNMGLYKTASGNRLAELLRIVRPIADKLEDGDLQVYRDAWRWVDMPASIGNNSSIKWYIVRTEGLIEKYNLGTQV